MSQDDAGIGREVRSDNYNRKQQPTAPVSSAPQKKEPTARQKWNKSRPTKMIAFWLCVGSVALALLIGFRWGGWTTGGAAQKQATVAAQGAVVERLTSICVAQSNVSPQFAQKLTELQAVKSASDRATYVTDQGWATMPGDAKPDNKVADQCAKQLLALAAN
jgi:hypothetical protein